MSGDITWEEVAALIAREGPFIAASADISDLREHFRFGAGVQIEKFTHAISMGYPLNTAVLDEIENAPTILYKKHYQQVNAIMDRAATLIASFIQSRGGRSLPVPASVFVDWNTQAAHLSHKMIAKRAGLGWIGRNILLITPEWGARVRLVSVLTDVPFMSPPRPKGECGSCARCVPVCPVGAIKTAPEDFNLSACTEQTKYFEKHGMSVRICGICVKACRPGSGKIIQ
jgi:epoxyqueuosine reductase QueG